MLHILLSYPRSLMSFMSLIPIIPLYQAGRMVAEDLELTVETLRCREDREASGLVKKVRLVNFSPNSLIWSIWRQTLIFFSEFRRSSNLTLYLTYHCIHLIVCMILKSQKSFRSMRNPVRPPVGFFNRRLSTRQNSNSDKVSRHFHFLHLLWLSLSRWFASFFTFTFIIRVLERQTEAQAPQMWSHTQSPMLRGER